MLMVNEFSCPETLELLGEAVSVNTMDSIENSGATEKAMLKFIKRCGIDFDKLRANLIPKDFIRF